MPPEQQPSSILHHPRYSLIVAIIAVFFVIAFATFYMNKQTAPIQPEAPATVESAGVEPETESLGGALYEKASNPLEDKLPEQSPVANPITDAYKNPF